MKELAIGTKNSAKVDQIRGALANQGVSVRAAGDDLPEVIEDGQTPQENARKKALAYAKELGVTVLSMDNALYLDGLADKDQPGMHVRRINGRTDRPTDEECLAHYSKLISVLGGRINGRWEFAICIATPDGQTAETTIISPRIFVGLPSTSMIPGYPIESLQIEPASGKYIAEMSSEEKDQFWQNTIGQELAQFVESCSLL